MKNELKYVFAGVVLGAFIASLCMFLLGMHHMNDAFYLQEAEQELRLHQQEKGQMCLHYYTTIEPLAGFTSHTMANYCGEEKGWKKVTLK